MPRLWPSNLVLIVALWMLAACGGSEIPKTADGDPESDRSDLVEAENAEVLEGDDVASDEPQADVSWLSAEELAKPTYAVGDPCVPDIYYPCDSAGYTPNEVGVEYESTACEHGHLASLKCRKNAQGLWRYERDRNCVPYSLCLSWVNRYEDDCYRYPPMPDTVQHVGMCEPVCRPGRGSCTLSSPALVGSSGNVPSTCEAQRAYERDRCLTVLKGQPFEDGLPFPKHSSEDCLIDVLTPLWGMDLLPDFDRLCNRCIVWTTTTWFCADGQWNSKPGR